MTQLPIYRAERLSKKGGYVEGNLVNTLDGPYISIIFTCLPNKKGYNPVYFDKIDPDTLAIHFPDMLDFEDEKIFASLNENGKAGSMTQRTYLSDDTGNDKDTGVCLYRGFDIVLDSQDSFISLYDSLDDEDGILEVIGIQE